MIPLRIVLASLACLCPFSLAQEPKSDPDKTLIIISTSDIHGNLDNFPRLATLVKQYRAKYPHVLLVDSGDYFIGNPYVDDCEKRGEPLTILMNKLGYDVVTIGNHDRAGGPARPYQGNAFHQVCHYQRQSFPYSGKLFLSVCQHPD